MRALVWQRWPLGLGVLITLLVGDVVTLEVRAGCASPVPVPWLAANRSHQARDAIFPDAFPNSLQHSMPSRWPCSGPQGSGTPLAPLVPPAITMTPGQDWACLPVSLSAPAPQGAANCHEESSHTPIYGSCLIYHPPRRAYPSSPNRTAIAATGNVRTAHEKYIVVFIVKTRSRFARKGVSS
jgi:hypothetical protein